jgi:hypothetical protein
MAERAADAELLIGTLSVSLHFLRTFPSTITFSSQRVLYYAEILGKYICPQPLSVQSAFVYCPFLKSNIPVL